MRPLHVLVFAAVAVGVNVVANPPEDAASLEERSHAPAQRGGAREPDYPLYAVTLRDLLYRAGPYRQPHREPQPIAYNPWLLKLAQEMARSERLKPDDYQSADVYAEHPAGPRLDVSAPAPAPEQYDYDSPVEYDEGPGGRRREPFALRPQDERYYSVEPAAMTEGSAAAVERRSEPAFAESDPGFQNMRQLRQNPMKMLVAENAEGMQPAQAHAEAHKAALAAAAAAAEGGGGDVRSALAPPDEPPPSLYAIAIFTAVGAALSLAVAGVAVGWYTLSMKAKAAEDVDYPAYGVTGPCGDPGGDRRLAHSAQMYHYQHQKQQIIAMERGCGTDERSGSVSDPESEEDNAEGDYTVYECPGYATTGDMEVKNPLFSEEPTPATPAAPAAAAATSASPAIVVDKPAAE